MSAWEQLLTTVIYPTLALSLAGLVPIGFSVLAKKLGVQAAAAQDQASALRDQVAHSAVQGAVATFAGKVLGDVEAGTLTLADVRSGAADKQLVDYAASTVGDSLIRHAVTPETLSAMLVGRVNALVAPAAFAPPPVTAQAEPAQAEPEPVPAPAP